MAAASTARFSDVPAGRTSTTSPPRTARARPSSSPVSLSPPSPRKAAWILTRRILDHILSREHYHRSAQVWLSIGLMIACVVAEGAVLRVGIDDLDEGYF